MLEAFHFVDQRFTIADEHPFATLEMLMEGRAQAPFQYRILVPKAIDLISQWRPDLPPDLIWRTLDFTFALGLIMAMFGLLRFIIRSEVLCALLALLSLNLLVFNLILPVEGAKRYPPDLASPLFLTLGLIALRTGRMLPFYLLFAVATFNRETTCFLTVAYLFNALGKHRGNTIALHCVAQFIIWMGIKTLILKMSPDISHGGLFDFTLLTNLKYLAAPWNAAHFLSTLGFIAVPVALLWRQIDDPFTRRTCLVCLPYLAGMLFVGLLEEVRIFTDLLPMLFPAYALILVNLAKASSPIQPPTLLQI